MTPKPGPVSLSDQFCASNGNPVCWNPWNKVVQDHRDGTIDDGATNYVRRALGLPCPWTPEIAAVEVLSGPIYLPADSLKPNAKLRDAAPTLNT